MLDYHVVGRTIHLRMPGQGFVNGQPYLGLLEYVLG